MGIKGVHNWNTLTGTGWVLWKALSYLLSQQPSEFVLLCIILFYRWGSWSSKEGKRTNQKTDMETMKEKGWRKPPTHAHPKSQRSKWNHKMYFTTNSEFPLWTRHGSWLCRPRSTSRWFSSEQLLTPSSSVPLLITSLGSLRPESREKIRRP